MDVENERNRIHPDICWHGYRKQVDSLYSRIRDNMDHPNWFGSLDLNSCKRKAKMKFIIEGLCSDG